MTRKHHDSLNKRSTGCCSPLQHLGTRSLSVSTETQGSLRTAVAPLAFSLLGWNVTAVRYFPCHSTWTYLAMTYRDVGAYIHARNLMPKRRREAAHPVPALSALDSPASVLFKTRTVPCHSFHLHSTLFFSGFLPSHGCPQDSRFFLLLFCFISRSIRQ